MLGLFVTFFDGILTRGQFHALSPSKTWYLLFAPLTDANHIIYQQPLGFESTTHLFSTTYWLSKKWSFVFNNLLASFVTFLNSLRSLAGGWAFACHIQVQ